MSGFAPDFATKPPAVPLNEFVMMLSEEKIHLLFARGLFVHIYLLVSVTKPVIVLCAPSLNLGVDVVGTNHSSTSPPAPHLICPIPPRPI